MTDVLFATRERVRADPPAPPAEFGDGEFYLATLHRPDNTDDPERLADIIGRLARLKFPVLLAVHPRLAGLASAHGISLSQGSIRPIDPLPYPGLVATVSRSAGVITDSGGLQKEAFLLRVPCTTIRPETEWVETVDLGWNRLVGDNLDELIASVERPTPAPTDATPYGDGAAARRVVAALTQWHAQ